MNSLYPNLLRKKISCFFILTFSFAFINTFGQQRQFQAAGIAFYNVENLFDTIKSAGYVDGTKDYQDEFYHISIHEADIPNYAKDTVLCKCVLSEKNVKGKKIIRNLILQEEFAPNGPKAWNTEKYLRKISNISNVISKIGSSITKTAPVVVGLAEVENREVVQDLINQPALKQYNYGIAHFNSWDKRGIDVALIYQKDRFKVLDTHKYELVIHNPDGTRDYTRDILRVSGLLDGEKVHFIVNHWPSRRGGEAVSLPKRMAAGKLLRSIYEEVLAKEPNAKIIAMGDFNDDPVNKSFSEGVKNVEDIEGMKDNDIFNAMISLYKKGQGTLAYRDSWNLFDQMLFSKGLLSKNYKTYQMYKTAIYSPSYLISKEGAYKGFPNRTFGGDTFHEDGYSDHFPVYTILLKEVLK